MPKGDSRRLGERLSSLTYTSGWAVQKVRHSRGVVALGRGVRRVRSGHAPEPPSKPVRRTTENWPMNVLTVGERSLPQCLHYRVLQKQDVLGGVDVPFTAIGPEDLAEALSLLQVARVLIIYRLPKDQRTRALVDEAHRLGVPVVFEADDVVYRQDLVAANPNLDRLPWSLRAATIKGAQDYLEMLKSADFALASTQVLADDMARVSGKPAFVVENGIDPEMLSVAADLERQPDVPAQHPRVIYGSGSLAHDRDFAVAAAGLARWLHENPHARFTLVGSVTMPSVLKPVAAQVDRLPELPFPAYLRELRRSSIALAPLTGDPFNLYKSPIRYLESGLMGTPLVASRIMYDGYVNDEVTGMLVDDAGWYDALSRLTTDRILAQGLAHAARQDVRRWDVGQRPRHQMKRALQAIVPNWRPPA